MRSPVIQWKSEQSKVARLFIWAKRFLLVLVYFFFEIECVVKVCKSSNSHLGEKDWSLPIDVSDGRKTEGFRR